MLSEQPDTLICMCLLTISLSISPATTAMSCCSSSVATRNESLLLLACMTGAARTQTPGFLERVAHRAPQ